MKKRTQYLIIWDEEDKDPYMECTSLTQAKEKAAELLENDFVVEKSIKIFKVAKILIPKRIEVELEEV